MLRPICEYLMSQGVWAHHYRSCSMSGASVVL